jgi:hypothetical protein
MGMFLSQTLLCNCLAQLPDFDEFGYIFRLRTDCAVIGGEFEEKLSFDPNAITISKNHCLPDWWLSDHIIFASVENYFSLWKSDSIKDIYKWYSKGKRNPERTLAARFKKIKSKAVLNSSIERFVDYHIVYNPPRDNEPFWVKDAIARYGIRSFFENIEDYRDVDESREFNRLIKERFEQPSLYSRIISRMKRFKSGAKY